MNEHAQHLLRCTGLVAVALFLASATSELSRARRTALAREAQPMHAVPTRMTDQLIQPTFEQRTIRAGTPEAAPNLLATATRTPTPINIGNFVWDDLDQDGRQDAGEPGVAGVTVQLWNSAKTQLLDVTSTTNSGIYSLTAPVPGDYRVRVLLPSAGDQFSPKDNVAAGETLDSDINPSGVNFGFTDIITLDSNLISTTVIDAGIIVYHPPTATRTPTPINIGNFVWYDINANGIQDVGEPGLSSITVQLWNSSKTQLIDSAVTTNNGIYTVVAPVPGDYRIRVLPPSGAFFSPKDQGANDTLDSDINPSGVHVGFTDTFTLAPNVISTTIYDAGLTNVPATPTPSLIPTATATSMLTPTLTLTPTSTASLEAMPTTPFAGRVYLPGVRK